MPRPNKPTQRQGKMDTEVDDDVLALNSDTEGEPLVERLGRIAEIARHVTAGGEFSLLSTTLPIPITHNPWRRQHSNLGPDILDTTSTSAADEDGKGYNKLSDVFLS
jgi:hypothetical protein